MLEMKRYFEVLTRWKQKRYEDAKRLAEIRGEIKTATEMGPNDATLFAIGKIAEAMIMEMDARQEDFLDIFEIVLRLSKEQAKEIDVLKSVVASLASEKKDLSKKLEEMDKWRREYEPMLTAIDETVKQTREFFDQNR